MENIQFNHIRCEKQSPRFRAITTAANLPTSLELPGLINDDNTITLQVGTAYCSMKDSYIKRVGREVSTTKLQLQTFRVRIIEFVGEKIYMKLESVDTSNKLEYIIIRYLKDSGKSKVHLVNCGYKNS